MYAEEKLKNFSDRLKSIGFIEKQQMAILELFVKTNFFNALPFYIDHIRTNLEGEQLTEEQIIAIKSIANNPTINSFHDLFERRIGISAYELYLAMVIHSQRNFNLANGVISEEISKIAFNSVPNRFINSDPNELKFLAILGATYEVMKDKRLIPSVKFFEETTGRKPEQIIFLTGFRDAYMLELVQLNIFKYKDKSEEYKCLYNKIKGKRIKDNNAPVTIIEVVKFFRNHKEENIDNYIDKEILTAVLDKLSQFSIIDLPENISELSSLDRLDIFAQNIRERELGYLAIIDSGLYNNYHFNHVYSDNMNNVTGTRANTQDTILEYLNKYWKFLDCPYFYSEYNYNSDLLKQTLLISNNLLAMQQFIALIAVIVNNMGKESINSIKFNTASPQEKDYSDPEQPLSALACSLFCASSDFANIVLCDNRFDATKIKETIGKKKASEINISYV